MLKLIMTFIMTPVFKFVIAPVFSLVMKEVDALAVRIGYFLESNQPTPEAKNKVRFRVAWLRWCLIGFWCLAFTVSLLLLYFEIQGSIKVFELKGVGAQRAALAEYYARMGVPYNRAGDLSYSDGLQSLFQLPWVNDYFADFGMLGAVFDVWVLLALLLLASTWIARTRHTHNTRLSFLILMVFMVMGRLPSLFWTGIFSFLPNGWWFFPVKYLLLPPLTLLFSGAAATLALYMAFMAFLTAVVFIPIKVLSEIASLSKSVRLLQVATMPMLADALEFWFWYTGREMPKSQDKPDDSKGARFAHPSELADVTTATENEDPLDSTAQFGYVNDNPLKIPNEKHVLIMASTRSGKGVSLIIPHLLRYRGSAFVLDPKGENARVSAAFREQNGQTVHVLDPFHVSGLPQARFNPLARLTPENMEAESKALAAALVIGERDHWTAAAQQLLAAFILFVVTEKTIPPNKNDLKTVRTLLLGVVRPTLEAMKQSTAADGLLSMLALSFLDTPEKEFGSILSTAQRQTEILDNPHIAACLAADGNGKEVDFALWHKKEMTVYLCLSAPKFPVFNRWLRLVLTSALDEMTDKLAPPKLPVCFMLDELAALGHLECVENAVGLAAGYGIQLWTVFQDVAQIKDLYKGRWSSFVGNAGVRAVFNLDDYDTAHYWSQFMGGHLVETTHTSRDKLGYEQGQNVGETQRPLLSPEEIMFHFAAKKMLILAQGMHPIIADRVPYFVDDNLNGKWVDPRNPP